MVGTRGSVSGSVASTTGPGDMASSAAASGGFVLLLSVEDERGGTGDSNSGDKPVNELLFAGTVYKREGFSQESGPSLSSVQM